MTTAPSQPKVFRDMMSYYGILRDPDQVTIVNNYNTHNDNRTRKPRKSEQNSEASSLTPLQGVGLIAATVALSALKESSTTTTSSSGSPIEFRSKFSTWNKRAHEKELDQILKFKEATLQPEEIRDEIIAAHLDIVKGNCAKATGLYRSTGLFSVGAIGGLILQSRILRNNPAIETAMKVVSGLSMTSSLGVFCWSHIRSNATAIDQHYSTSIRNFAYHTAQPVVMDTPQPPNYDLAHMPSAPVAESKQ